MNPIRTLMTQMLPAVRLKRRYFGPTRPTWSEQFEAIATTMRLGSDFSLLMPIAMQRKVIDPERPDTAVVRATQIDAVDVDGIPGQWFRPKGARTDRVVVYFHGGGYSTGSLRSHRDLLSRVAAAAGLPVLAVDYRLAPEHPFPAQLEDATRTLSWLESQGFDRSSIALAGESAGGHLSLATLLALRDRGERMPVAAVLISPWLDLEASAESFRENAPFDFVTRRALRVYAKRFAAKKHHRNPLAAPHHAEVHGLPPILIQVGEVETLRDEGVDLARKIERAGGRVELEVWTDMIHAFHVFAPLLPPAQEAIERAARFLVVEFDRHERSQQSGTVGADV